MARGINKVILIGHLGNAPELRQTSTGGALTQVSLATSESWKDKQTGQTTEKTEWHRVIFFNRVAEIVAQYCQKGSKLYVEGRLQTRKWTDKDGLERYTTEIIAQELQLLDSRGAANQPGNADELPTPSPRESFKQAAPDDTVPSFSPFEDEDIPF